MSGDGHPYAAVILGGVVGLAIFWGIKEIQFRLDVPPADPYMETRYPVSVPGSMDYRTIGLDTPTPSATPYMEPVRQLPAIYVYPPYSAEDYAPWVVSVSAQCPPEWEEVEADGNGGWKLTGKAYRRRVSK